MLPEFSKLWATAVEAGAPETAKRTAARLWLAAYAVGLICVVIAAIWGAYVAISSFLSQGTPARPAAVASTTSGNLQPAVDIASRPPVSVTTACSEIARVAAGYDLSDQSQHLAARAALEKVITGLPDAERLAVSSLAKEYVEPQWISGNPSAALSKLLVALACK